MEERVKTNLIIIVIFLQKTGVKLGFKVLCTTLTKIKKENTLIAINLVCSRKN